MLPKEKYNTLLWMVQVVLTYTVFGLACGRSMSAVNVALTCLRDAGVHLNGEPRPEKAMTYVVYRGNFNKACGIAAAARLKRVRYMLGYNAGWVWIRMVVEYI